MLSFKKNFGFVNGLVLLFFVGLLASCGGADGEEYLNRAKEYLKKEELNAASLELKNALLSNGQNGEARYLLGKIKLSIGDASSAEKEMRRALDAGWDEAETTMLLAEALIRQGKYEMLLKEIRAKDKYPKTTLAEILGLRAAAYTSLEQWDDAVEAVTAGEPLQRDARWLLLSKARIAIHNEDIPTLRETLVTALLIYPDSKDLWLLSAGLSAEDKDFDDAISALQKVIELDPPKMMTAWGRQARIGQFRIYLRQNDLAKADAAITPVLKVFSGDPEANYLGALLAFVEQKYDLAEERLLTVLRAAPEHREALLLFGRLNYVQKDFQQAAYYLEKATSTQPGDVPAQSLLGKTYLMLGQYDDAEKKLRFASTQSADNAELLALVSEAKMRSGDAVAGLKELEKAAAANPADKAVSSRLANTYLASGNTAGAVQTLENALAKGDQGQQLKSMLLLTYVRTAEYEKAHELADEIITEFPEHPLSYNLKAVVYEGQADLAAATEYYNKAVSLQEDSSMAQLSLARLELAQGKKDQAEKRYRKMLEKQPENSAVLVALAKLIASNGQVGEAIGLLEKARKVNPAELEGRLILANYFLIRNEAEQSLTVAKEALRAVPQSPSAMLVIGRAQLVTDKSAALKTLNQLVEYSPTFAEAHFYLAQAKSGSGDVAGAQKSLQQAVKLKPDYLLAQLSLARIDLKAGHIDKVLTTARQMLQQHKENASVYLLQGDAYLAKKDFQAALPAYLQAEKYTDRNDAVLRIAKLYQRQGKHGKAIKALTDWLKNNKDNFGARFYLAISYLSTGESEKAYIEYTQLNKKHPDNPAVLNDLAWLKYEKGEPDALKMAERAYNLSPDNAAIQDTYGWILLKSGRVETALSALQQASAKWPTNRDIRYHYLAALAQAGEKQRAKKELDVLLDSGKAFAERESAKALRDSL